MRGILQYIYDSLHKEWKHDGMIYLSDSTYQCIGYNVPERQTIHNLQYDLKKMLD